jgi:spore coat polysaccharide biosynthesis protein SpsF
VYLVGHSLGGFLSAMTGVRIPHLVRGVLLLDSPLIGGWRAQLLRWAKRSGRIHAYSPGAISQRRRVLWDSEEDVMSRVIGAAESVQAEVVVEITGDCPIIDPDLVEQTIRVFKRNEKAVYCANSFISSYPDGMDTQVMTLEALKKSFSMTNDPLDREHVSRHIVQNPQLFPHVYLIAPPSLHWPGLGLTLDEPADYELIRTLIENLGHDNPLFGCGDVIRFLRANPQVLNINDTVQRKDARPT